MLRLSDACRLAVTILLVATLPLCCCNGRPLAGIGRVCGGTPGMAALGAGSHASQDGESAGCCGDRASSARASGDGTGEHGRTPQDRDQPGGGAPCSCGEHQVASKEGTGPRQVASAAMAGWPPQTVILSWAAPVRTGFEAARSEPVPSPATSLLRLHCALIV